MKGPGASKFRDKGEEVPSYKNLLLWMVRLIHADPMLMLNVSSKLRFIFEGSMLIVFFHKIKFQNVQSNILVFFIIGFFFLNMKPFSDVTF